MAEKFLIVTVEDPEGFVANSGYNAKIAHTGTVDKRPAIYVKPQKGQSIESLEEQLEQDDSVRYIRNIDREKDPEKPRSLDDLGGELSTQTRKILKLESLVIPMEYDDFDGYIAKGYRTGKNVTRHAMPVDRPEILRSVHEYFEGGILGHQIIDMEIKRSEFKETNTETKEGELTVDVTLYLLEKK